MQGLLARLSCSSLDKWAIWAKSLNSVMQLSERVRLVRLLGRCELHLLKRDVRFRIQNIKNSYKFNVKGSKP